MKETFAIRLQKALDKSGMKAADLARLTNTPESVISQYKSGKYIPKQRRLEVFAEALHTTIPYLMGDDDDPEPLPEGAEVYQPQGIMPVLGVVAAGLPMYADENIIEYIACDYSSDYEYFALVTNGDSMNAIGINNGDYVIVRKQEMVENGDIAVVLIDNEAATVKQFSQKGHTVVLTPCSSNPVHKVQIYDLKDTRVKILGKVVESRHKF